MVIARQPFCWKWISVTKVSKYGKSEYSRALNASYTFQSLWVSDGTRHSASVVTSSWWREQLRQKMSKLPRVRKKKFIKQNFKNALQRNQTKAIVDSKIRERVFCRSNNTFLIEIWIKSGSIESLNLKLWKLNSKLDIVSKHSFKVNRPSLSITIRRFLSSWSIFTSPCNIWNVHPLMDPMFSLHLQKLERWKTVTDRLTDILLLGDRSVVQKLPHSSLKRNWIWVSEFKI